MFHRIYLPFRLLNINNIRNNDTKILRGKTYTYKRFSILFEITLQVAEIFFIMIHCVLLL